MPFTIAYNKEESIIEVKITGKLDHEILKDFSAELTMVVKENNCYRMITDYREALLDFSTLDIFKMPQFLSDVATTSGLELYKLKRALVTSEHWKDFSFYETVSVNRGYNTKVFKDVDEARQWLTQK